MAWTDEKRSAVIAEYIAGNPTPENSMELVKTVAEKHDETPNGVRMVLQKAAVYVKKEAAATASKPASTSTRVSKGDSLDALRAILQKYGVDPTPDIVDKLTGKQAVFFAEAIKTITSNV